MGSDERERFLLALADLGRSCRGKSTASELLELGARLLEGVLGAKIQISEVSCDGELLNRGGSRSFPTEHPHPPEPLREGGVTVVDGEEGSAAVHWVAVSGRFERPSSLGARLEGADEMTEGERFFLQEALMQIGVALERRELAATVEQAKTAMAKEARLRQQLEEVVHLRDEFLLVASHELRTPLTPLYIELQVLERLAHGRGKELEAKVRRAKRQVDRLWRMTEGMLEVSRVSADKLTLELDVVDLGELVTELAERFGGEARRRGVELRVDAEGDVLGFWDRQRLEAVFVNLLTNAIRFGASRPVKITVERRGDVARVEVADRGIGVEADQLEAIFRRYARAVSFREYGGLGLGLFLTRKLVEAHGGRVWAEQRDRQGARFVVELPWGIL